MTLGWMLLVLDLVLLEVLHMSLGRLAAVKLL
jgi:hypothetical protein